jgi:hypothetical protein
VGSREDWNGHRIRDAVGMVNGTVYSVSNEC